MSFSHKEIMREFASCTRKIHTHNSKRKGVLPASMSAGHVVGTKLRTTIKYAVPTTTIVKHTS